MNETLDQAIVVAAETGNLDGVQKALEEGASPNAMGPNSGALHCAAFNGHGTVVELLLSKGAKADANDVQGYYPIHLACSRGHVAIAKQLINAGANVDALTSQKGTALHVAAASNYAAVIPVLLEAGANIEAQDVNGLTPLAAAASLGNTEVVRLLIDAGADANNKDLGGDTPLIKALRQLYGTRTAEWIYEEKEDERLIRYEIKKGCFRCDRDYNPSEADQLGDLLTIEEQRIYANKDWGPKNHLRYLDALDTAMFLIQVGADVNAANDTKQTPINMACHTGEALVIQQLYDKGAVLDVRGYQNATPLHRVSGSGRLDGLEQFLKLGAVIDANAVDDFGWTALHYLADIGGPLKMATLLLEKGVDPAIKSKEGRGAGMPPGCTAEEVALHWKDTKLARVLK